MKKICVNEEQCIGCGACVAIDPEHFDFNDNGLSNPVSQENLESDSLNSAVESCPTGAISVKEENEENLESDSLNSTVESCPTGAINVKEENEEN